MGDMIRQMAFAIADAQMELDESSIRVAELMSGRYPLRDEDGNLVDKDGEPSDDPVYIDSRVYFGETKDAQDQTVPQQLSMMELGFTPTFYQFVDTLIEVKIAIRMSRESETTKKVGNKTTESSWRSRSKTRSSSFGVVVSTTTVDASYSSKYSYSAEGSSLLRTKLVPVPPPAVLEERIRQLMEQQKAAEQPAQQPDNP
ncbi:MAG: hypothetical protein H6703_02515 [Myxococcales bacterium]|nr:hypothetical protein [Myxococcales bacterium]MCB9541307.1 hypothetical protein [Myxococcales bacterium]MCB9553597.1 hypothetical protein [Myxococcales bacterium]